MNCEKCGWFHEKVFFILKAKCYWGCPHTVCVNCAEFVNRWQHA